MSAFGRIHSASSVSDQLEGGEDGWRPSLQSFSNVQYLSFRRLRHREHSLVTTAGYVLSGSQWRRYISHGRYLLYFFSLRINIFVTLTLILIFKKHVTYKTEWMDEWRKERRKTGMRGEKELFACVHVHVYVRVCACACIFKNKKINVIYKRWG